MSTITSKQQATLTRFDRGAGNLSLAIRNSFFGFLSSLGQIIGNSVVFVIIARLPRVDVADFGQLTYAFALGSLFSMFAQFGLAPLVIRNVAADPGSLHDQVRSAFSLRLIFSVLTFGVLIGYLHCIRISPQGFLIACIISVALYASSFSLFLQAVFQSQERMHWESLGIFMENGLLISATLLAVCFNADVVQVALVFLVTRCAALLLNYVLCGRCAIWVWPTFDASLWKKTFIEAAPFAAASVISLGIVQIDTVLMRELLPAATAEDAVGLYQASIRLFLVPMLLPQIVLKVFLPQLSRMHGQQGAGLVRDLGRVNHVLMTLGILVGMVTVFRGDDLVRLIYGEKLQAAGPVLQVLGFTLMMRFGAAYNLYFTIRNRIWFRVLAATLVLGALIGLDCLLIPRFGPLGAAYASVLAHLFYWAIYFAAIYLEERTLTLGWQVRQALGAVLVVGLFVRLTSTVNIAVMLPVYALVVFLATLVVMVREDRNVILARLGLKGVCSS
jgi:O-antigen/teichoic acid export membrane protein